MSRDAVYDLAEAPFSLYAQAPGAPGLTPTATTRWSTMGADDVNAAFFSARNVDAIQAELRAVIKARLGYVIDRQPDDQLLIVMRYVYMNESRNAGGAAEVRRLNRLVLKEIVPQVASALVQYLAYLRDASRLPTPIPRAEATSVKGTLTASLFQGV